MQIRILKQMGEASHPSNQRNLSSWILIVGIILVLQLVYFIKITDPYEFQVPQVASTVSLPYALDYPRGKAVALPSIIVSADEDKRIDRKIYGGKGDAKHLGGFTEINIPLYNLMVIQ